MTKARPIFKKENLLYERKEKEGYFTIISKIHPEARELIINRTAREILDLSNGKRSVEEIKDLLSSRYENIPKEKIIFDVSKTLSVFSRLGIVEWIGENPFLVKQKEPISDGHSLYIAQEDDLRKIEKFIQTAEKSFSGKENFIFYKNPTVTRGEYSELVLRQKLFAFSEEFFLLTKGPEIEGLLSISVPLYPGEFGAIIKLLICPKRYLPELFDYSKGYFPYLAIKDVTKLKFYESGAEPIKEPLKNFVLEKGFKKEGELKNELGFGKDLIIYSLYYSEEFIKKVKKQRGKFTQIA